jgi:hypothetical protein
MIAAIWAFLSSPLGRRLAIAAGILAAVLVLAWHFHHVWVNEGKEQQRGTDVEDTHKTLELEHATFAKVLDAESEKYRAATQVLAQATDALARADQTIRDLATARQTASQQVARLSDAALPGDLRLKLNVAPLATGPLLPAELRAADAIVSDYPILKKENEARTTAEAAANAKVSALSDQLGAVEAERDAAFTWSDTLMGAYVQAYNAVPRARRSPACLWLWKCGAGKKLPIPKPAELLAHRPQ